MSVKVVNSGGGTVNVKVETTPTISVSTPEVKVVDVNPVYTSSQPGPSGPAGPAGSDGQGLEPGGDKHQVLKKVDDVDYNTEWGFADRVFISVKFDEAVSAGDPVYVSGYQSGPDVVKVSKADSSDSAKMPAIGLAIEDYSLNAFGSVACIGSLYGIDTDDFDVGDVLYVKSGGGLTKDKPTGATNLIQNVGKVGRSQQNNGEIVVMAIGRSNDVPNIEDGKIWIGNGSGVATPTTLNAAAIPDFDTEVSNNSSVVANTAKETNVTTNLSFTRDATSVTVTSSDGDDAVLPESSTTQAGVMSAASHQKLANLNASADVTNSSSVEAAGAIMDSDFTSNGLMERTGDGSYDVVAKNTDNISEGSSNFYYTDARADARVSAVIDTDNTLADPSDTLVPSQAAIKTYVDNQLGTQNLSLGTRTATQLNVDISGGGTSVTIPAANTTEAGLMTEAQFDKLASIDDNATNYGDSDVNAHLSGGTGIGYNNGVISVDEHTTISTDQVNDDATITVTGPSGQADVITLAAGSNITLTEAGDQITIASTASGGASALDDLSDVTIGATAGNQYLVHNGVSAFQNQALDISHDTDPDLGGDLDVGTHEIQSTSTNDLVLKAAGTGKVSLVASDGDVELVATGVTNYIKPKADVDLGGNSIITSANDQDISLTPDGTGQINLGTYPIKADDTAPDSGDNLKVLTYVHGDSEIRLVSNPQGTVTTNGTSASTRIATFTATTNQISGQSDGFTFDGSSFTTPNVLVEEGTLSAPGRYGSGARVTRTMFTDANTNKTAGDVYVMNSSASVWTDKADADAASTASGLLAVAASTQSAVGMVLSGIVRMADNTNFVNADKGDILYLDTVAGQVTATKPTGSSKVVRVVGYVVYPGIGGGTTNDGVIYFDPSKDWIELNS